MINGDDSFFQSFYTKLRSCRIIPDEKNNLEYRQKCYDKWKDHIPCDIYFMNTLSVEDLTDLLIGYQLYLKEPLRERLSKGANKSLYNESDLASLLKKPLQSAINDKTLVRAQQGLDFVKDFVRDLIYQTKVKGKYSDPTKNLDDVRPFLRAMCICMEFDTNVTSLTVSKLAGALQLTGGVQVVSNFRCMSAAYLFWKYGVEASDSKDVNILVPSEGFLGRLLASYYVAYHYRDKNINYHTIDPNEYLRQPFDTMVKYLSNYGSLFNKVTNWHPKLYGHGSEVRQARLRDSIEAEFDITFTSPPYGAQELYLDSAEIYLVPKGAEPDTIEQFINDKIPENEAEGYVKVRLTSDEYKNSNIKVGDKVEGGVVAKVLGSTQSHGIGKHKETWNEFFFRPTVKNMKYNLKLGGYMIWNVGNTKAHPSLEQDVVGVCESEGLKLVDTLEYELSRRPGSKGKPTYEPVFVFQKVNN